MGDDGDAFAFYASKVITGVGWQGNRSEKVRNHFRFDLKKSDAIVQHTQDIETVEPES